MDSRLLKLFDEIYTKIIDLDVTANVTKEPLPYSLRGNGKKIRLKAGDKWGELWDCAWMNMRGKVPEEAEGKKTAFIIDVGGEGLVFDRDGNAYKGLTNKESYYSFELGMPAKTVVLHSESQKAGEIIDFWVDCGANDLFGECADSDKTPIGILHKAYLASVDSEKRELYYDLEVIWHLAEATKDEKIKVIARGAFEDAIAIYEKDLNKAKEITRKFLANKSESDFKISALGHAHIDLGWLWPIRETKRKAARTFSTLLCNSELYGDYLFGVSQPQMLEWVKDEHPALFKGMKKLYSEKKLELQGGFWVECDVNVPSGESLIRQLLYGKRFWKDEFGYEQEIMWIPDVFGYNAQLPQIMAKAGIKYFLTIKMSWNAVNKFPHSTFNWVGLDGTEILTHMPPEGNYNSAARAESFISTEDRYMERGIDDRAMLLFGIGDGGGGPGMEHLERLHREYDLVGLPKVKQQFAIDFFNEIAKDKEKFPRYEGELYLEKHQGTYTTQSRNKRSNRKSEYAFHDLEIMSTAAAIFGGYEYPKERVEKLWKEVLLYQFHDILPGSAIKRVYDETDEAYARIAKETEKIFEEAFEHIKVGGERAIFNPSGTEFKGFIKDGENKYVYAEIPPFSFGKEKEFHGENVKISGNTIDNGIVRVCFDEDGSVKSVIMDGEEYLDGNANILTVYQDTLNGWEVPADYAVNPKEALKLQGFSTEIIDGVAERKSVYTVGDSILTQTVVIYPHSARIDFKTEIDWQETHKMLRAAFPLSHKSDEADCEIQYGVIKRPTHRRDSFAKAKKEVCAQRFVDISDGKHGAALINDCKYGYRVWDSVIDIDLLRSSTYPGADADKGTQIFTYSFYPHKGNYVNHVTEEAYKVNDAPIILNGSVKEEIVGVPLVKIDGGKNLFADWVKLAEDGSGIVVRAYESAGEGGSAKVSSVLAGGKVFVCDELENELFEAKDGRFEYKPFEIITLKIKKS